MLAESANITVEVKVAPARSKFLSSLTSVIIKPSQLLKKTCPLYADTSDHWVPNDFEEIAEFPQESLEKYRKVHPNVEAPKKFKLVNGEFSVLASPETLTKEVSTTSVNTHKQEKSREEKLTKNELVGNDDKKKKEEDQKKENEKLLYHLAITLYNENAEKYVMSLFRSHQLAEVVALCERCRENPELFRVFPRNVNIKEYLHLIFNELRDNMTWKSVHISAKIGLIEYFENLPTQKIEKNFNSIVQPEGLSPLMIAIQYDQIDTVKWMLEHDADINCLNSEGGNVLHVAATSSGEMIKLLWETKKCATMLNKSDSSGNSPAYIALSNACIMNCSMLRNFGTFRKKRGYYGIELARNRTATE
uniref:ANK_REP_REGION domain-containing protein n=1 Tax=Caenorhabditis japonica TaxID=281687 RepID=A0A8R1IDJ3_CAEJA